MLGVNVGWSLDHLNQYLRYVPESQFVLILVFIYLHFFLFLPLLFLSNLRFQFFFIDWELDSGNVILIEHFQKDKGCLLQ